MSSKILRYRFDGSGAWFLTLASLGENMDIRFGKKLAGRDGIEWIDGIDHAVYHGVGGSSPMEIRPRRSATLCKQSWAASQCAFNKGRREFGFYMPGC